MPAPAGRFWGRRLRWGGGSLGRRLAGTAAHWDGGSLAKLSASMKHLVDVAAPLDEEPKLLERINLTTTKLNQPASLQTAVCWHKYLTASLCKLYSSSAEMDEKIHATAMHMQHLGMKHPAEKKAAYGAGLIHFTTDAFLMDQVAELVIGRKIKEMLRQRWAFATGSEMKGPSE